MFKHVNTLSIDRFTNDFMVFLKDRSPVLFCFLSEFLTWIPSQDAYTKIRYKDHFTMVKLGDGAIMTLQRSFLVGDQVIASITFANREKSGYCAITEVMRKSAELEITAGKEASDENLTLALGESKNWLLSYMVAATGPESINSVALDERGTDPTRVTYIFSSDIGSEYFMEIEMANPRFLKIFCELITHNVNQISPPYRPMLSEKEMYPKFIAPEETRAGMAP